LRVIAFIGSSGTGKSYRAMWVAKENDIDFIIDDGLLIQGNRLVAGNSAKKEHTKLASIKRALFQDAVHAQKVRSVLESEMPDSILILGTSLKMIESIIQALKLPPISQVIYIEDVAGQKEIDKAREIRRLEGKHVIPVPTFEIKKDFSGYFIAPLRILKRKTKEDELFVAEKSVVRPTFSYLGKYVISDNVINSICRYEAMLIKSVVRVNKLSTHNNAMGLTVNMEISLKHGIFIPGEARKVQERVKKAIEEYTSMNIISVNITVRTIEK
jgi:uncharacterized alkaline shock family protein YloU